MGSVHRALFCLLLIPGLTCLAPPVWGQQAQSAPQEQWRYVFHNGEWWYWLPENRWVYWRNEHWNDYLPKTPTTNQSSSVAAARGTPGSANPRASSGQSESRPYYGHAESTWGNSSSSETDVRPAYGHALPDQVYRGWGGGGDTRPFYGHAGSNGD